MILSPQGISVFTVPALVIEMTPPYAHMHLLVSFRDGMLAMGTVGEPGAQGAGTTGTHGAGVGVGTPRAAAVAAAVAAATAGLDCVVHIPKVGIFTTGLWSMMLAAGLPSTITRLVGSTIRADGAAPNEHCIIALATTCFAIADHSFSPRTLSVLESYLLQLLK
jgi:hypothetical protein